MVERTTARKRELVGIHGQSIFGRNPMQDAS